MYVVIVGAGRVGLSLARWLVATEHEVTVIDSDSARCAALDDELGSISLVGDGTDMEVLARGGTNRAEILIAATGRDDFNAMACQLARHHFGVGRTVSLVNIPDHERLFSILGIDVTIDTTDLITRRIQEELSGLLVEEAGDLP